MKWRNPVVDRPGWKNFENKMASSVVVVAVAMVMTCCLVATSDGFTLPGNVHRWLVKDSGCKKVREK